MIAIERGNYSMGASTGSPGQLDESGTLSPAEGVPTPDTATENSHQPEQMSPQVEEPSWYTNPPAETQSGLVDSFVAQHAIETSDYVESAVEAEKLVELRQILDSRKSMELIGDVPLAVLWAEIKRSSEDHFVALGHSVDTQKRTFLYHVLHGSSPIPGLPINSFDLPGGLIETLIRDGGFNDIQS